MAQRQWMDHAFWENYQKDRITGILVLNHDNGKKTTQQLTVYKFAEDGSVNPDFQEIVDQLGEEKLDDNTTKRAQTKAKEAKARYLRDQHEKKQKQLAELFDAKLQAFEIDEIKNSKNRDLKSRLRKSRNILEMQIYAQMIMREELGL